MDRFFDNWDYDDDMLSPTEIDSLLLRMSHEVREEDHRHGTYTKLEALLCLAQKNDRTQQIIEPLSMQGKIKSIAIAFRRNWYKIVIWLIEQGVEVHHIGSNQENLVHSVLNNYSPSFDCDPDALLACVVKLVESGVGVNYLDEYKFTPIYSAAAKSLYKVVIYLIDHGADVHYIDDNQSNLLHIILYHSNSHDMDGLLPCVIKLIVAGVGINNLNTFEDAPISIAAEKRRYDVVMYLIDHGGANYSNLLHIILYNSNSHDMDGLLPCVIKLVVAGVGINNLNTLKEAPISIAAVKRRYEVMISLIDHGADVHYMDVNQNNLLHTILYNCTAHSTDALLSCITKLVEAGVSINHQNESKEAPISIATSKRLTKVVIYLIDHGADLHYIDNEGMNLLQAVLHSYRVYRKDDIDALSQCVVNVVQRGVDVNHIDKYGNTAIIIAARRGLYKIVLHLIEHGAHVHNVINRSNLLHTVLEYPTDMSNNYTEKRNIRANIDDLLPCVTKLAEAGVDIHHLNKDNLTPIFIAAKNRFYKVVMHMFKLYSFTELMSPPNGVKLLYEILACKKLELFDYYIRSKLIVKGYTTDGENMLHLLARVNYDYSLDKFNWLLNGELDINHPDSKTNTPAMVAAVVLNSKYLELLTHHPTLDINAQNNQGHTALHLCIIGFTMVKNGLNKRQKNDVVEKYCRQIYPIYMDCVDNLLAAVGIDMNIPDSGGITALMMAAMKNDRFLIRKLLNAGAVVNCNGKSALHHLDIYESVFDQSFKLMVL